jgi:hypothetical protein
LDSSGDVSVLGWWQDRKNYVELTFLTARKKNRLRQHSSGTVVNKKSVRFDAEMGINYHVQIVYNGYSISAYWDGFEVISLPAYQDCSALRQCGYRLKSIDHALVKASFREILVTP